MNIAHWKQHAFSRPLWPSLLASCALLQPIVALAQSQPAQATYSVTTTTGLSKTANISVFPRVTAQLNGVFSPRGFFNIMVRVYQLQGVVRAKLDLKESRLTLDFAPGVVVSPAEIRSVMVNAGYSPGPFKIQEISVNAPPDNRPGWVTIKHPRSHSALIRWLEINF